MDIDLSEVPTRCASLTAVDTLPYFPLGIAGVVLLIIVPWLVAKSTLTTDHKARSISYTWRETLSRLSVLAFCLYTWIGYTCVDLEGHLAALIVLPILLLLIALINGPPIWRVTLRWEAMCITRPSPDTEEARLIINTPRGKPSPIYPAPVRKGPTRNEAEAALCVDCGDPRWPKWYAWSTWIHSGLAFSTFTAMLVLECIAFGEYTLYDSQESDVQVGRAFIGGLLFVLSAIAYMALVGMAIVRKCRTGSAWFDDTSTVEYTFAFFSILFFATLPQRAQ